MLDSGREAVLREIAEKYEADFPNTEIEVRSFESAPALEEALRAHEIDIAEVESQDQAAYVKEGLLLELDFAGWEEYDTLTQAAKMVCGSMKRELNGYLFPNDIVQELLYYRADWFNAYNADKPSPDRARYDTWEQIITASEQLGGQGRLAFAGQEKLLELFNTLEWSAVPGVSGPAAYLFADETEVKTFFSSAPEQAAAGVDQFARLFSETLLPETLDWTQEQALEAFQNGEAGMLLGDRSLWNILRETMPEGSWGAQGLPKGLNGVTVSTPLSFTGWGISSAVEDWETAFHFLAFLSNADNNTHYAKVCGTLPIHMVAENLEESLTAGDRAAEIEMVQKGGQYQYAAEPTMYEAYKDWRTEAEQKLRRFASGELSQTELLDWMDSYWTSAYQKEGVLF